MEKTLGSEFLKELEEEARATRKCLERVPADRFEWAPHEKSMKMGYLSLIVAEIPRWITTMIEEKEINFGTFKHEQPKTADDLVRQFDTNMEYARKVLAVVDDRAFDGEFVLRGGDQIFMKTPIGQAVRQTINHMIHHRGQLTVYLRLCGEPVPSIYGPSADDKTF